MEQQFKKLIQKTKAQKEQKDPLFKTFEGALFENSAWFFQFLERPVAVVARRDEPVAKIETAAPEKIKSSHLCEVLFVGDTYGGQGDDLLGKMISAMKLTGGESRRFLMDDELEEVNDLAKNLEDPEPFTLKLLDFILKNRPKIVVSLGATVTNILLGKREKLSTIHGQFFEKKTGDCVYSLMPLFHPDYLVINPNMKRTAWTDLQKVMERVGKI